MSDYRDYAEEQARRKHDQKWDTEAGLDPFFGGSDGFAADLEVDEGFFVEGDPDRPAD